MPPNATATPPPPAPDTRPLTDAYPTALRRGNRAFRRCAAPERTTSPIPRRPTHRESIAMLLRTAGTLIPDPSTPTGWRRVPAFRAHGAIRSLMMLDALWWYGISQGSGTARTGTSTLAWLMAQTCGWKRLPAAQMIDTHAATIRRARERLTDAGLVLAGSAQDEHLQDRATDWQLRPPADDLTDEELAAADDVIAAYRARHPDVDRARRRSAAALAERWRTFLTSIGRQPEGPKKRGSDQSAPLPSGPGGSHQQPDCMGLRSSRARSASDLTVTRPASESSPDIPPRMNLHGDFPGEDGRAGLADRAPRQQQDASDAYRMGREVVRIARLALPEHLREQSGVSRRRSAQIAILARDLEMHLGVSADRTAAMLAQIVVDQGVPLHQAPRIMRRDLIARGALPDRWQRDDRGRARRRAKAAQREMNHALRLAEAMPSWLRIDPRSGRPMTWTRPDATSGAAPTWLCCTALPSAEVLNDPDIRRLIHAAAVLAGITGPQRRARAIASGEADRMRAHHVDFESYAREVDGNGTVALIDLSNGRAAVPPADSTAPALRWQHAEPAPTRDQRNVYVRLSRRRARMGLHTPPPPPTAREMAVAIAALLP